MAPDAGIVSTWLRAAGSPALSRGKNMAALALRPPIALRIAAASTAPGLLHCVGASISCVARTLAQSAAIEFTVESRRAARRIAHRVRSWRLSPHRSQPRPFRPRVASVRGPVPTGFTPCVSLPLSHCYAVQRHRPGSRGYSTRTPTAFAPARVGTRAANVARATELLPSRRPVPRISASGQLQRVADPRPGGIVRVREGI